MIITVLSGSKASYIWFFRFYRFPHIGMNTASCVDIGMNIASRVDSDFYVPNYIYVKEKYFLESDLKNL